ncbi:MAG: hypothetical protein GX045_05520 [Clostridiaceae bacterium]|jgi:hypothetical protein|nr:hypothetical protein [Clostridiaceae bacterium]
MIKCEQCLENLSAYVDGELPEEEKKKLDIHLKECSACSKELELVKAIVSVCKDLTEELPENFETSLHKRLEKAKEDIQVRKRKAFDFRLITQIAAGFIIIVTLGLFIRSGMGKATRKSSDSMPEGSLRIAEQAENMNTTLAMSSRNGDTAGSVTTSPSVTIAGTQVMDDQSEETVVVPESEGIFALFSEKADIGFQKIEGHDTQVKIETEDVPEAIKTIMIIEEKLGENNDENKNSLQNLMVEYGGTREGSIEMELYYHNDETWHMFLNELKIIFPDMEVKSVPAAGKREQIRIILSNNPEY